jgi:glutamate-ammonia-ligase adenylyltransferase
MPFTCLEGPPLFNLPESELAALPDSLRGTVTASLHAFSERLEERKLEFKPTPEMTASMVRVFGASLFVSESCTRQPNLLIDLVNSGDLSIAYDSDHYRNRLADKPVASEAELMAELRRFRRREMVRIAWRDLAGWAELTATLSELSWLADACIQFALDFLYQELCRRCGTPLLANGQPQNIIVLGMGKLGAHELNFSSDIDLIFAFAEEGVLPDRKETSYSEFFSRLCRSLVKVLDEITADGFVFRTDIRLRPFGDSGAVIMTFDGMENYYLTQAREWERYAMIKARQVAGDFETGKQLMAMLRPFVYRRYLDYGAFEELRSLKAQITQELRRKDRMENVKLGPGGIREIEFIGQAFQLIRGGSEKSLQTRGILDVLRLLGGMELLTLQDAERLQDSYCFLRRVENHIQQYQDRQTHDLPTGAAGREALAYSMNYPDWESFKQKLDQVRAGVHEVFDQVFSLSRQEGKNQPSARIWNCTADEPELLDSLAGYGFDDAQAALDALRGFKSSVAVKRLTAKGAGVLDRLMPQLLDALRQVGNPDETLKRMLSLFEAVAGRTVYLALLYENPEALSQLLRLTSASSWISEFISRYPILLDELLDPRSLLEPLQKQDLTRQLKSLLAEVDVQDLEQTMILLRQFKHQQVLKVAAADIMGVLPLMVVSDYLTYIAESIVEQVIERVWLMLTEKHGCPPGSSIDAMGFAVLGFGKLGGIELGYGSDLDLVFLYDAEDGNAPTDGVKPISAALFYGRMGLKVRHMLDTKMLSGVLYEVDMRLRPSGDSGLLVSHINGYREYLFNQAWTWEHQALVRGRFIAGDPELKKKYEAIRREVLSLPRDTGALKKEVREMREKMRAALATKETDKFDLKQSKGGIADIEFLVQFGILDQAAKHQDISTYTDNVRLLQALAAVGFMSKENAGLLRAAYCLYRDYGHKLVLQGDRAVIDQIEVAALSRQVGQIWHDYMER